MVMSNQQRAYAIYEASCPKVEALLLEPKQFIGFIDFNMDYCGASLPEDAYATVPLMVFRSLQVGYFPHEVRLTASRRLDQVREFFGEFMTGHLLDGQEPGQTYYFSRYEDAFHFRMRF
jgi:hypothetical protein